MDPLSRVEERASVLILQALPPDISTRALSSVALLFLTMSRFQPGGSAEKATILAYLTQPTTEGPAQVFKRTIKRSVSGRGRAGDTVADPAGGRQTAASCSLADPEPQAP